jgi:hypothetical protein
MHALTEWLGRRGNSIAAALESQREPICESVSLQLETTFPALCYDLMRADAAAFQKHTYHEVPRRFHRVMQVLLRLASVEVIEREYRWAWGILPRYGVTSEQLLAQVRWYFAAMRTRATLDADDLPHLEALEQTILQIIAQITAVALIIHQSQAGAVLNGAAHALLHET